MNFLRSTILPGPAARFWNPGIGPASVRLAQPQPPGPLRIRRQVLRLLQRDGKDHGGVENQPWRPGGISHGLCG